MAARKISRLLSSISFKAQLKGMVNLATILVRSLAVFVSLSFVLCCSPLISLMSVAGVMYANALGVPLNAEEAAAWFAKAKVKGAE